MRHLKIIRTVLGLSAVSAVLIFGCSRLYNNGTEESGTNGATISAEEYPVEETAATEVTPSSDKELSLTESSSISFTFLGDCLLSTNAGDTRTDTFAKYAEKCDPSYFFEKAVPYRHTYGKAQRASRQERALFLCRRGNTLSECRCFP